MDSDEKVREGGEIVIDTPALPAIIEKSPDGYAPYSGAGSMAVTDEEATTLMKIAPDDDHEIKPTGELYLPQIFYRVRLNTVFKPGGWALVPMSNVHRKVPEKDYMPIVFTQKFHLIARGRFISEVWGEQDYNPKNRNMSEATALEGMKSNALVRACKDLGIGWECWDKRWVDEWKNKYAVMVKVQKYGSQETDWQWRKRTDRPLKGEVK